MTLWAITGGSGFLGLHLTHRLGALGMDVRVLDLEPAPGASVASVVGNILCPRDVEALCGGADVVVHAAAALPIHGPSSAIRKVNVEGTARVLAAAADARVRRVVFLSSAVVYGIPAELPLREETAPVPIDAYGASKLEAEQVCAAFGKRGLEVVVLRPTAFVGPGRLGVFGILFDWISEGRRVYTLGPGTNRYQLLAVEDLVAAVLLAAERPVAGKTFNLGAVEYGTVGEDLRTLIDRAGSTSRVTAFPPGAARVGLRALAAARLSPLSAWHYRTAGLDFFCDVSKAARELDWTPRRSNVEALVGAYRWHGTHRAELAGSFGRSHRTPWNEQALSLVRRVS
jgi:nucleoside-diphosphate-sugar epimerase